MASRTNDRLMGAMDRTTVDFLMATFKESLECLCPRWLEHTRPIIVLPTFVRIDFIKRRASASLRVAEWR
jgi:hypothetical protein